MTAQQKIISKQADAWPSLHVAFCAAQASFGEVVKSTKGARGKYAPLDAVLGAIVPALNNHGLVLSQPTKIDGDALIVETRIIHAATGECMSCVYPVAQLGKPHQETGAALSYAKRYSVLSLCGVAPENEDDDDNRTQSNSTGNKQAYQAPIKPAEKPVVKTPPTIEERLSACKAYLSKSVDRDDLIIRWESEKCENLRRDLTNEQQTALLDFYGQVISRLDEKAFA